MILEKERIEIIIKSLDEMSLKQILKLSEPFKDLKVMNGAETETASETPQETALKSAETALISTNSARLGSDYP